MRQKLMTVSAALLLLLIGCGTNDTEPLDLAKVRQIIQDQNKLWLAAYEEYDIAKILSLYTPDATVMPPNYPMVKGHKQIRSNYERMSARGLKILGGVMTTLEVSGKDSTVYEIGEYIINIQRPGMPVVSDTGKYNTIWKLQPDGKWRMYADCWNSNKPSGLARSAD